MHKVSPIDGMPFPSRERTHMGAKNKQRHLAQEVDISEKASPRQKALDRSANAARSWVEFFGAMGSAAKVAKHTRDAVTEIKAAKSGLNTSTQREIIKKILAVEKLFDPNSEKGGYKQEDVAQVLVRNMIRHGLIKTSRDIDDIQRELKSMMLIGNKMGSCFLKHAQSELEALKEKVVAKNPSPFKGLAPTSKEQAIKAQAIQDKKEEKTIKAEGEKLKRSPDLESHYDMAMAQTNDAEIKALREAKDAEIAALRTENKQLQKTHQELVAEYDKYKSDQKTPKEDIEAHVKDQAAVSKKDMDKKLQALNEKHAEAIRDLEESQPKPVPRASAGAGKLKQMKTELEAQKKGLDSAFQALSKTHFQVVTSVTEQYEASKAELEKKGDLKKNALTQLKAKYEADVKALASKVDKDSRKTLDKAYEDDKKALGDSPDAKALEVLEAKYLADKNNPDLVAFEKLTAEYTIKKAALDLDQTRNTEALTDLQEKNKARVIALEKELGVAKTAYEDDKQSIQQKLDAHVLAHNNLLVRLSETVDETKARLIKEYESEKAIIIDAHKAEVTRLEAELKKALDAIKNQTLFDGTLEKVYNAVVVAEEDTVLPSALAYIKARKELGGDVESNKLLYFALDKHVLDKLNTHLVKAFKEVSNLLKDISSGKKLEADLLVPECIKLIEATQKLVLIRQVFIADFPPVITDPSDDSVPTPSSELWNGAISTFLKTNHMNLTKNLGMEILDSEYPRILNQISSRIEAVAKELDEININELDLNSSDLIAQMDRVNKLKVIFEPIMGVNLSTKDSAFDQSLDSLKDNLKARWEGYQTKLRRKIQSLFTQLTEGVVSTDEFDAQFRPHGLQSVTNLGVPMNRRLVVQFTWAIMDAKTPRQLMDLLQKAPHRLLIDMTMKNGEALIENLGVAPILDQEVAVTLFGRKDRLRIAGRNAIQALETTFIDLLDPEKSTNEEAWNEVVFKTPFIIFHPKLKKELGGLLTMLSEKANDAPPIGGIAKRALLVVQKAYSKLPETGAIHVPFPIPKVLTPEPEMAAAAVTTSSDAPKVGGMPKMDLGAIRDGTALKGTSDAPAGAHPAGGPFGGGALPTTGVGGLKKTGGPFGGGTLPTTGVGGLKKTGGPFGGGTLPTTGVSGLKKTGGAGSGVDGPKSAVVTNAVPTKEKWTLEGLSDRLTTLADEVGRDVDALQTRWDELAEARDKKVCETWNILTKKRDLKKLQVEYDDARAAIEAITPINNNDLEQLKNKFDADLEQLHIDAPDEDTRLYMQEKYDRNEITREAFENVDQRVSQYEYAVDLLADQFGGIYFYALVNSDPDKYKPQVEKALNHYWVNQLQQETPPLIVEMETCQKEHEEISKAFNAKKKNLYIEKLKQVTRSREEIAAEAMISPEYFRLALRALRQVTNEPSLLQALPGQKVRLVEVPPQDGENGMAKAIREKTNKTSLAKFFKTMEGQSDWALQDAATVLVNIGVDLNALVENGDTIVAVFEALAENVNLSKLNAKMITQKEAVKMTQKMNAIEFKKWKAKLDKELEKDSDDFLSVEAVTLAKSQVNTILEGRLSECEAKSDSALQIVNSVLVQEFGANPGEVEFHAKAVLKNEITPVQLLGGHTDVPMSAVLNSASDSPITAPFLAMMSEFYNVSQNKYPSLAHALKAHKVEGLDRDVRLATSNLETVELSAKDFRNDKEFVIKECKLKLSMLMKSDPKLSEKIDELFSSEFFNVTLPQSFGNAVTLLEEKIAELKTFIPDQNNIMMKAVKTNACLSLDEIVKTFKEARDVVIDKFESAEVELDQSTAELDRISQVAPLSEPILEIYWREVSQKFTVDETTLNDKQKAASRASLKALSEKMVVGLGLSAKSMYKHNDPVVLMKDMITTEMIPVLTDSLRAVPSDQRSQFVSEEVLFTETNYIERVMAPIRSESDDFQVLVADIRDRVTSTDIQAELKAACACLTVPGVSYNQVVENMVSDWAIPEQDKAIWIKFLIEAPKIRPEKLVADLLKTPMSALTTVIDSFVEPTTMHDQLRTAPIFGGVYTPAGAAPGSTKPGKKDAEKPGGKSNPFGGGTLPTTGIGGLKKPGGRPNPFGGGVLPTTGVSGLKPAGGARPNMMGMLGGIKKIE
ncbi:hypothetical protein HOH87_02025 [bacterium]|nr:hypothetical protein [bacterium]